jgi:hypothetical protein
MTVLVASLRTGGPGPDAIMLLRTTLFLVRFQPPDPGGGYLIAQAPKPFHENATEAHRWFFVREIH